MPTYSEESPRKLSENPDLRQPNDFPEAARAPTPARATLTAAKTVVRWLRWAIVLGLVSFAWSGFLYYVVAYDIGVHACPLFLLVAGGAKIAPRYRLVTALVLAAVVVSHSFWGHLLANQGPWVTTYQVIVEVLQQIVLQGLPAGGPVRHFLSEALGAVLGVVYVFWSEQGRASVASVAAPG